MWSALGDEELSPVARLQPPPYKRGTIEILWTCIITLVLCVWTAIHLNIPSASENDRKSASKILRFSPIAKQIKYLLMALFMPELPKVSSIAFNQWLEKRDLTKFMRKSDLVFHGKHSAMPPLSRKLPDAENATDLQGPSHGAETPNGDTQAPGEVHDQQPATHHRTSQDYPWTDTHSWYAVMGGFVVENSPSAQVQFPFIQGLERLTLTSEGVKYMAIHCPDAFPKLKESDIIDKSKSDGLAKTIVCLQATWFCVSMCSRLARQLPLTVLELNTAAHCICTLVTYCFWWSKPVNIKEPTALILDEDSARELAALYVTSTVGNSVYCELDPKGVGALPLLQRMWLYCHGPFVVHISQSSGLIQCLLATYQRERAETAALDPPPGTSMPIFTIPESMYVRIDSPTQAPGESPRLNFLGYPNWAMVEALGWGSWAFRRKMTFIATYVGSLVTGNGSLLPDDVIHLMILPSVKKVSDLLALAYPRVSCDKPRHDWCDGHIDLRHVEAVRKYETEWLTEAAPEFDPMSLWNWLEGRHLISFVLSSILYLGIHMSAWNGPFRTFTELVLWRTSSLVFLALCVVRPVGRFLDLAFRCGIWVPYKLYEKAEEEAERKRRRARKSRSERRLSQTRLEPVTWWLATCFYLLSFAVLFPIWALQYLWIAAVCSAFVVGRVFLVVESFLALPYAPDAAFDVPNWVAYFPHIG